MKGESMKLSAFDVLFLVACGIRVESCDFTAREHVWELDGDAETTKGCDLCAHVRQELLAFGASGQLVCQCGKVFLKDSGAIRGTTLELGGAINDATGFSDDEAAQC